MRFTLVGRAFGTLHKKPSDAFNSVGWYVTQETAWCCLSRWSGLWWYHTRDHRMRFIPVGRAFGTPHKKPSDAVNPISWYVTQETALCYLSIQLGFWYVTQLGDKKLPDAVNLVGRLICHRRNRLMLIIRLVGVLVRHTKNRLILFIPIVWAFCTSLKKPPKAINPVGWYFTQETAWSGLFGLSSSRQALMWFIRSVEQYQLATLHKKWSIDQLVCHII